ncbi:out at first protein-like [Hyalella azteca]|uniref:Out at first protein-like n=1 Tax=Hyalella azteca TaxID=294128 RepID=A0A8B7P1R4_HYAAZ|nr:out at first protein-like [Hyalella azteca]
MIIMRNIPKLLLLYCIQTLNLIEGNELVVNVKSLTGEIFKEKISSNSSDDWISLEYTQAYSTHVTHILDFKQELQVVHVVRLGEEELGQKPFQQMCFISKFSRDDFISSDAMSKLRQKNPWTVRTPEENLETDELDVDLSIDVDTVGAVLSPHVSSLCSSSPTTTFASSRDLKSWLNSRHDVDSDWASLSDGSHQLPSRGVLSCNQLTAAAQPCICQQQVCLWWYPCGLKFCKDRDDSGKAITYRCGIRTCRRCRIYSFYAATQAQCIR